MIPKRAIEKAIEGDWKGVVVEDYFATNYHLQNWQEIALDKTFWQALGEALGWGNEYGFDEARDFWLGEIHYPEVVSPGRGFREIWNFHALRFYDLVLTGGDTEKFWAELVDMKRVCLSCRKETK